MYPKTDRKIPWGLRTGFFIAFLQSYLELRKVLEKNWPEFPLAPSGAGGTAYTPTGSVESIDRAGVMALARLHNESITKSKKLSIVGLGCKELYDHFKSEEPETIQVPAGSIVAA